MRWAYFIFVIIAIISVLLMLIGATMKEEAVIKKHCQQLIDWVPIFFLIVCATYILFFILGVVL